MYNFNYKLNDNDYFEFNKYHLENSPEGKRNLFLFKFLMPFFCLIFAIIVLFNNSDYITAAAETAVIIIMSVIWIIFSKKWYFRSLKKSLIKLRKQGKLPYSSEGTLIFDEEFISDINPLTECKTRYENIENIALNDTYIYIFYGAIQAYIVPLSCFRSEEEKQNFIDFITAKTK